MFGFGHIMSGTAAGLVDGKATLAFDAQSLDGEEAAVEQGMGAVFPWLTS